MDMDTRWYIVPIQIIFYIKKKKNVALGFERQTRNNKNNLEFIQYLISRIQIIVVLCR